MTIEIIKHVNWSAVLAQLALLAGGIGGANLAMRALKRLAPILKDQNVALRVILTVLSVLGALAKTALSGELHAADLQDAAVVFLNAAAMWVGAHTVHKVTKPEEPEA